MNRLIELRTKLRSLVIFRNLLKKKAIIKLEKLLIMKDDNNISNVDLYCDFVAELFQKNLNLSDYILNFMLNDDNLYIDYCCRKKEIDVDLKSCLKNDILILQEISMLKSDEIKEYIDYDGYLPQWKNKNIDLFDIYLKRLDELPTVGFGKYAKYHVFSVQEGEIVPVKYPDPQRICELTGYEDERQKVIENTKALIEGKNAANVLLYGDAGTGKSSTIKAICNEFKSDGLRLIEIKKNQLYKIPLIIEKIAFNPLKFIMFVDDLSFSKNDNDFSALKAILEGSVSGKTPNIAVYATSNRRHLVKESFSDREGDEIHLGDTLQEIMSLSARFGLKVTFSKPDKVLFKDIVLNLAKWNEIDIDSNELLIKAEAHALRNGGRSPRVAKQFIEQLKTNI